MSILVWTPASGVVFFVFSGLAKNAPNLRGKTPKGLFCLECGSILPRSLPTRSAPNGSNWIHCWWNKTWIWTTGILSNGITIGNFSKKSPKKFTPHWGTAAPENFSGTWIWSKNRGHPSFHEGFFRGSRPSSQEPFKMWRWRKWVSWESHWQPWFLATWGEGAKDRSRLYEDGVLGRGKFCIIHDPIGPIGKQK